MFGDVVKRGQLFYYSANIEAKPEHASSTWFGSSWSDVAARVAAATAPFAQSRVVGAGDTNITLAVTATMDRASENDIRGNIDEIVARQPEVARLLTSMIRLTDAGLNPPSGQNGSPGLFANITPAMWAVIGLGLYFILKR